MITTGYEHLLLIVVKKAFSFLSHMELQLLHSLLLQHLEAPCFAPLQLKQGLFFEETSRRSSALFTA